MSECSFQPYSSVFAPQHVDLIPERIGFLLERDQQLGDVRGVGRTQPRELSQIVRDRVPFEVILAAESEWGVWKNRPRTYEAVLDDFCKFLDVSARFKLIVYGCHVNDGEEIEAAMARILQSHRHAMSGEDWLFVGLPWERNWADDVPRVRVPRRVERGVVPSETHKLFGEARRLTEIQAPKNLFDFSGGFGRDRVLSGCGDPCVGDYQRPRVSTEHRAELDSRAEMMLAPR